MTDCQGNFLLGELMALSQDCSACRGPKRDGPVPQSSARSLPCMPYEETHVTAEIRRRMQHGESLSTIARGLNRDGLRGAYGGRWYAASVQAYINRRSRVP